MLKILCLVTLGACNSKQSNINHSESIVCDAETLGPDSTWLSIKYDSARYKLTDTLFSIGKLGNVAKSGSIGVVVNKQYPYGFGSWIHNVSENDHYKVSVWRKGSRSATLIVKEFSNRGDYFYQTSSIPDALMDGWEQISIDFRVPNRQIEGNKLGVYVCVFDSTTAYLDDLEIQLFEN